MRNSTRFTLRSAQFTRIMLVVVCVQFVACATTYDMPVMYKKNYVPGTHDSLRFDGYYTSKWDMEMTERVIPIYLYRNGSVWFGEQKILIDSAEQMIQKGVSHSWGNFQIKADTIFIERFLKEEAVNNYRRITLKGIIHSESILWIQREVNRQNPVAAGYTTIFMPGSFKPDSTGNWTRTRPQYNK